MKKKLKLSGLNGLFKANECILSLKLYLVTILLCVCFTNCVKKEADGKEFCAKNCKSTCEMVGGNVSACINDCIPACENAGPNPFYNKN